jgi:DNA-binding LytR/AlgR family response regulator
MTAPTALIADDEPLLREQLAANLTRLWPELQVVAQARNGRAAVELFDELRPQVVFLDVHMPGMNGVEAARCIDRRAEIVFVTAYDRYAVEAFAQGAIDYLVKPIEEERLLDTVQRLQARLQVWRQTADDALRPEFNALLERMAAHMAQQQRGNGGARPYLQWIKASVGATVRLIPIEQVLFLRADAKYTMVAWEGGEALIRTSIRELADALRALRSSAPRGDRQPRACRPLLARAGRVGRGAPEGPQRAARRQPQLRAPVPADVRAVPRSGRRSDRVTVAGVAGELLAVADQLVELARLVEHPARAQREAAALHVGGGVVAQHHHRHRPVPVARGTQHAQA